MSKKYKGFKGSGYNKKPLPKHTNKTLLKIIKKAIGEVGIAVHLDAVVELYD